MPTTTMHLRLVKRKNVRGEIGLLSLAYEAYMDEQRLTFNPCLGVRSRKPVSKRTRLLLDREIDAIIAKANERTAVAIELAYATGLRIGDLCRLRWSDFEDHVRTQKTGARQVFEVTDGLRTLLDRARALQARIASLYVLCDRGGAPLKKKTLWRHWVRACKAAGVVDAHFHDLRAAGATEMDRRGGDAQKFLGHRTRQTTEVYLRDRRLNVVTPLKRKM